MDHTSGESSAPQRDVRLDPVSLRGLAHPLRVQALGWLRRHGPATATQLAAQLGQSSGATSYHLRQLAAYGFVVDDPERGNGRERWWRAVHRATIYDSRTFSSGSADEATKAAGAEYVRAVGRQYANQIAIYIDAIESMDLDFGPEWAGVFTMSDWPLTLTAGQATELTAELERLANKFRDACDEPAVGSRSMSLQVQLMPVPEP